jgi:hypothetical protein
MTPSRKAAWRRQRAAVERERRKLAWLPKRDRRRIEMEETAELPKGWGVNPGHPGYAQWLMKLGFPVGDPLIELASVWAGGHHASSKLIRMAMLSAESWMESKDKRMRGAARSVRNKLEQYLAHAQKREGVRPPAQYRPHSLTTGSRPVGPFPTIRSETVSRDRTIAVEDRPLPRGSIEAHAQRRALVTGESAEELAEWMRRERHRRALASRVAEDRPESTFDEERFRTVVGKSSFPIRGNPRRRRNPRTYHVRDQYLGEFHDYSKLKAAMRKARQLNEDIMVERDEMLVPLSEAYPSAGAIVARANPLPNEHSARLISPSQVVKGTYRRRNVKGGSIGLLFAKVRGARKGPRGGSMKLASVHFRAAHFTPAQARKWMKEHGLRPILFEAARNRGKAAWRGEAARVKRGRRAGVRGRRRVA